MTVWIAQECYLYEGSSIIGAYSTETKAMQACQDYFAEHSDKTLVWKQSWQAEGHNDQHFFDLTPLEVDE